MLQKTGRHFARRELVEAAARWDRDGTPVTSPGWIGVQILARVQCSRVLRSRRKSPACVPVSDAVTGAIDISVRRTQALEPDWGVLTSGSELTQRRERTLRQPPLPSWTIHLLAEPRERLGCTRRVAGAAAGPRCQVAVGPAEAACAFASATAQSKGVRGVAALRPSVANGSTKANV